MRPKHGLQSAQVPALHAPACPRTCRRHSSDAGARDAQSSCARVDVLTWRGAVCRWIVPLKSCLEAGAAAGVMMCSAGCFGSIISSRGHDVHLIMQGVASDSGLLNLFSRLKKVQKAVRAPHPTPCTPPSLMHKHAVEQTAIAHALRSRELHTAAARREVHVLPRHAVAQSAPWTGTAECMLRGLPQR